MEQIQQLEQQLSQQQLQNLKLLQMSEPELQEYIQSMSLENPVIDEVQPDSLPMEPLLVRDNTKLLDKWRWLENGDLQNRSYQPDWHDEDFSPLDLVGNAGGLEESLPRFLRSQIELKPFSAGQRQILYYLIDSLDDDGYLRIPPEELSRELGIAPETLKEAVCELQSLEPAGVGAASLSECLTLQLLRSGASPVFAAIARDHLEDLSRYHDLAIAQALKIRRQEVAAAREAIRKLNPRPGSLFYSAAPVIYVRPDLYITETDGLFSVRMAREEQARFSISPYYLQLYEETEDKEVRTFLSEKLRQAEALRFGIRQRDNTLKRCAEAILMHQTDYFRRGSEALKPLSMTEIAKELGFHVSTVSRAVKNKYLESAQGTVPLQFFFSLPAAQSEKNVIGSRAAMACLQELIRQEDKAHPLSDQKLAEQMARMGCELSRRTVAKYRGLLGLPGIAGRRKNE